ncbi:MAG: RecQ family ATP-dependent DNA helicase [Clostridia bacterium]|nr:RecQ family ATP-dependent DNA helicase [Clostridia bacterium]
MTLREALQKYFGHNAFRPGQEELAQALLQGRDALGVMPTGAGKSYCYQTPALVMPGIALIVSPLISLMKDQVATLIAAGVPAAYLNSSLTARQFETAMRRAEEGAYRIIYVAPERLEAPSFLRFAKNARISLIAVDEAHCVSQWGQDFRPSYLKIADFVRALPVRPPVGAFTATATAQVRADIVRLLELKEPAQVTTGFDRPNLWLEVLRPARRFDALAALLAARREDSGIVYCAARKTVEQVTEKLNGLGLSAVRYHAGLSDDERRRSQEDFQYDRARIMVATNAFGMGIDKSNVRYVIHYNMPRSMEAYYQEAGRAGRDGDGADCVLLYSRQDIMTARYLIDHAQPNEELTEAERIEVRQSDLARLNRMVRYCEDGTCLRGALLRYFGQPAPTCCEGCANCLGARYSQAEKAMPVKRGAPKATFSQDSAFNDADAEALDDLMVRLKARRLAIAQRMGVPAYVIADDKTLRDMARRRPANRAELLKVHGVGEIKADRYGGEFLAVIEEWKKVHPGL